MGIGTGHPFLSRCSKQSHHDTDHVGEHSKQVTITDPQHPLYGRTYPLIRIRSRAGSQIAIIRQNGHRRSIPKSATDLDRPPSANSQIVLTSAQTLLPLARYVHYKLLPTEDHIHGTSSDFNFSERGESTVTTTTIDERALGAVKTDAGCESASRVDKDSGGHDWSSSEFTRAGKRRRS